MSALCDQAALALQNAGVASRLEEVAISQERSRIAQEIHDGLSQSLTGLVMQLESIKRICHTSPDRAESGLETAITRARGCLAETRNYMKALRDSNLADASPVPSLKVILNDFNTISGIHSELIVRGADRSIPAGVARTLLRIAQESLANINQHARATEVKMTLTFDEKWLYLNVADNGIGFDIASVLDRAYAEGRFGVLGMRERGDSLGGTFSLESTPGRGTTVSVQLPTGEGCQPAQDGQPPAALATETRP